MKKTIQINIGGRHFHIDEDAFQKLNHYLEALKAHFAVEGDTGKEIMEDIEQRIAELLESKISGAKLAITLEDIQEAITVLGKVEDFDYADGTRNSHEQAYYERRDNRRFFRDEDNNYIGGVAAGLGAYFDMDPLWIRLIFIGLLFASGLGLLIYIILWIVVPRARTTAEKLQMKGIPVTLSTIKESVTYEYDKVKSNIQQFGHSDRTRNAVHNVFHAIGLIFIAFFKFIIAAIGVILLVTGTFFLAIMIMVLLGFSNIFGHIHFWNPGIPEVMMHISQVHWIIVCLIIAVLIPIIALIYGGIKILFNIRSRHPVLRVSLLIIWVVAICAGVSLVALNGPRFSGETHDAQTTVIDQKTWPRLYIRLRDNGSDIHFTRYSVFDENFCYNEETKMLYNEPQLSVVHSYDDDMSVTVEKRLHNTGYHHGRELLDHIGYSWEQKDSVIYIDRYLSTADKNFWMFPEINIRIQVPENQVVILSGDLCNLSNFDDEYRYCNDSSLMGKPCMMTTTGLTEIKDYKYTTGKNK
jgi:phage shock protein PspC (stress-responsive transcriptional regulator)